MKITRRPLDLDSLAYSREFDVPRSVGCHLMQVVDYIGKTSGIEKKYKGDVDLEPFATAGFIWEHVMSREDKLEHAMSVEALRVEMHFKAGLTFPGEMAYCRRCDDVMTGGMYAIDHSKRRGHKLLFFTPDGLEIFPEYAYHEWKFSWKSSKKSHPDVLNSNSGIWRWPVQCMFNCFGLETLLTKLTVLHCHGDYKPGPPTPEPFEIRMEFTKKEISRNTSMVITNARNQGWI
jgi:hypothetical protein